MAELKARGIVKPTEADWERAYNDQDGDFQRTGRVPDAKSLAEWKRFMEA